MNKKNLNESNDRISYLESRKQLLEESKVNILKDLNIQTSNICNPEKTNSCKGKKPFCCCDDRICMHIERINKARNISIDHANGKNFLGQTLRFLGPNGCVVPPEYRELCTHYICNHALGKVENVKEKKAWEDKKGELGKVQEEIEVITEELNSKFEKNYFSLFRYNSFKEN
jgi:hypothetical protein